MGILIDISNAFNSLSWEAIMEALRWHRIPEYLQAAVREYFADRSVTYKDRDGNMQEKLLCRGVPQGSVLGHLLWNLGYNAILRVALPPGCHTLCYADDTIVLAGGDNWQEARARAQVATQAVLTAIKKLGLKVAMHKTESLWFYDKTQGPPPFNKVLLDSAEVVITPTVKYLGLLIDGQWAFREHITAVFAKAASSATALRGILPNLGGPSGAARQLYANTVRSIVMYGAPVWANELALSRVGGTALEKAFHLVNVRVAQIYRTVSRAAAAVLAGVPPLDLTAVEHSKVFEGLRSYERRHGVQPTPTDKNRLRLYYRTKTLKAWQARLRAQAGEGGGRAIGAMEPILKDWLYAKQRLSFHAAQVVSGHGCFASYLRRIGKEESERCHHCEAPRDDVQHTLEGCLAWQNERADLIRKTGRDLSLSALAKKIVDDEEAYKAFLTFAGRVMSSKEDAERQRRGQPVNNPSRHSTRNTLGQSARHGRPSRAPGWG